MPELKTCVNCGHGVSSSATICPSCGSLYLFGSICKICNRRSSEKDGIEWPPNTTRYGSTTLSTLYHRACADSVLPNFRPNCNVCGADLRPKGGDRYAALLHRPYRPGGRSEPCPSCGEKQPWGFLTSCTRCDFALPESDINSRVKKGDGDHHYLHRTCARGCLGIFWRFV
jgi:hypothetical protein